MAASAAARAVVERVCVDPPRFFPSVASAPTQTRAHTLQSMLQALLLFSSCDGPFLFKF